MDRRLGWRWKRIGAAEAARVAQGAAAATIAWLLAGRLPNNYPAHQEPIFAPIAAFIALNAPLGDRGRNALRLLLGVLVGIVAGELAVAALPGGYGLRIASATLVATAVAAGFGGPAIIRAQAASGAILTVAIAAGHPGVWRLIDALVGIGVALVFSQVLFPPEPVALMRRAEATALRDLADGLELLAGALEHDDPAQAEAALDHFRDMREGLAELGRVRRASRTMARRSVVWRHQQAPAVRESENAGHLDLLAGSCSMLARMAALADAPARRWLAPVIRALAGTLRDLARGPGAHDARQDAADAALGVVRQLDGRGAPADPALGPAIAMTRAVAADLMAFAGVDADQAAAATRSGAVLLPVPLPPASGRRALPRGAGQRWRRVVPGVLSLGALASVLRRHRER